jgi:hypothetical protein
VRKRIAELVAEDFEARKSAYRELDDLGEAAAPELREAAAGPLSAEAAKQVQALLRALDRDPPSPGLLRSVRAVWVLEQLGSAEARRLLADLAEGEPAAHQTQEARGAVKRLEQRHEP